MAGQHQIWRHDLRAGTTSAFSGDGYERNANGASGPATSWAQVRDAYILRCLGGRKLRVWGLISCHLNPAWVHVLACCSDSLVCCMAASKHSPDCQGHRRLWIKQLTLDTATASSWGGDCCNAVHARLGCCVAKCWPCCSSSHLWDVDGLNSGFRGAVWVQPSGLSLSVDGRELWVADSESSTVRSMDLTTGGSRVNHLHWSQQ